MAEAIAHENWQRAVLEVESVHEVRAYTLLRNVRGRGYPCTQARWRGLAFFSADSWRSTAKNALVRVARM